jgi:hypothetical protein
MFESLDDKVGVDKYIELAIDALDIYLKQIKEFVVDLARYVEGGFNAAKDIIENSDKQRFTSQMFFDLLEINRNYNMNLTKFVVADIHIPKGFRERDCWKTFEPSLERAFDSLYAPNPRESQFLIDIGSVLLTRRFSTTK